MRTLFVAAALAGAAPLVVFGQDANAAAPQAAPAQAPAASPPPQYAPPPPGQYAPPPQYAPPGQGQYAPYGQGYAPPPQYAPPGYQPPPPAPRPRFKRDSWYIGFGLGGGDGKIKDSLGTSSFKEYLGKSPTTVGLNFKIGATLTPKILLGFDLSTIASSADDGNATATVGITNYDAVVTFFPVDRGFFLRGGLGLSRFTLDLENVPAVGGGTMSASDSVSGTNATVGLGYAFWLGQHFNLTLNLDFSAQAWNSSQTYAPTSSNFWALGVGFDWF